MKLSTALVDISYSQSFGIWAELIDDEFTVDSEARYGQLIFDNGGLDDGWVFACDGEYPAWHHQMWTNYDNDSDIERNDPEFVDHLINCINDNRDKQ